MNAPMPEAPAHEPSVEELQIARVYADAVWKVAVKEGRGPDFYEEFQSLITDVLNRQPQLEVFFQLSSISEDRRAQLIEHIFRGRASDLLLNFLKTLNDHERLSLLRAIAVCLRDLYDKSRGAVRVIVKTAQPMPDDQLQSIRTAIANRFHIEPILETKVDPSVLGGLWIRVGDMVYDRSVRWNLNQLRDKILTRSLHEIQSGRNIVDRSTGN